MIDDELSHGTTHAHVFSSASAAHITISGPTTAFPFALGALLCAGRTLWPSYDSLFPPSCRLWDVLLSVSQASHPGPAPAAFLRQKLELLHRASRKAPLMTQPRRCQYVREGETDHIAQVGT